MWPAAIYKGRNGASPARLTAHRGSTRLAIDMGPAAYERGHQTEYSIGRASLFKAILATWSRGEVVSP
jgi:hypothetical protein